jgi:hypothetical protein
MPESWVFVWTDREERAYATLRERGGHWELAWGHRDPPGGDNYLARGHHRTSDEAAAVEEMLARVAELGAEPDEAARVRPRLQAALAERRAAASAGASGAGQGER